MNRYIGNSILPLLIKHPKFYNEAENYASLLDATLHTVYRLSKNRMLTKGQRESVSDFLVALTSSMQPAMLLKLLRKLTVDVSKLSEYTTVALRVCFIQILFYFSFRFNTRNAFCLCFVSHFDSLYKSQYFIAIDLALRTLCEILWIESRPVSLWSCVR